MDNIPSNLAAVRAKVGAAAKAAGRRPDEVELIAVSKRQPRQRIAAAIEAGQRVFGENQVQEAMRHWTELKEKNPGLELHLIGPLQSNKAKEAVALFDVIQTVDRPKIARVLAREFERQGRRCPCFVEINTGAEETKAGVLPAQADAFIEQVRSEFELPLVGLMCIPPLDEPASLHFELLRKIAERNSLARLSMGMSDDFETAIRFGATEVRVGTAIFGPREDKAT